VINNEKEQQKLLGGNRVREERRGTFLHFLLSTNLSSSVIFPLQARLLALL
jgi:hypothetical protein